MIGQFLTFTASSTTATAHCRRLLKLKRYTLKSLCKYRLKEMYKSLSIKLFFDLLCLYLGG